MNSKLATSFVIICSVLCLAQTADAQPRIEPPTDAHGTCLEALTTLSADGSISTADLAIIENRCVGQESAALSYFETLMDQLNGSQDRPNFGTWEDAMAQLNGCRHIDEVLCPNIDDELPPPPPRTHTRSRLIVECRGACAEGPGITDGLRGTNWGRVAVCREGTVPLTYSYRHAEVEGEERETRHREDHMTLDIVYCYDPESRTAPIVIPPDHEHALPDLSAIWIVLNRHTTEIEIHSTRIRDLTEEMAAQDSHWAHDCNMSDVEWNALSHAAQDRLISSGACDTDIEPLLDIDAADCGRTLAEWHALSQDERRALHESGACDPAPTTTTVVSNDWRIQFTLGAGLHLVGLSAPAMIVAPHGIIFAELEALPTEHAGFFLRGFIGGGSLMDRIGQFNPEGTISEEGIAGGSAGLTLRANDMVAVDIGLASSFGFNPGGQIGTSLHAWPWFQAGGEVRVRFNPVHWFGIEATVGLDYTHAEIRRPNFDHFIGVDGLGGHGSIGFHFRF